MVPGGLTAAGVGLLTTGLTVVGSGLVTGFVTVGDWTTGFVLTGLTGATTGLDGVSIGFGTTVTEGTGVFEAVESADSRTGNLFP